jgi:hypothetical protein
MRDTNRGVERIRFEFFFEMANFPKGANALDSAIGINGRQARRIVTSILQTLEAFEQDWGNITLGDCADDSTHNSVLRQGYMNELSCSVSVQGAARFLSEADPDLDI